ncbi:hypothetical protein K491DRAFT_595716 [Lophiostoma macrostomum CBS 122681]|uniref:DUF3253 domain-containing protein n=1 Tax=Lophiostoma macrostomum CBS 122681 TaxID=1314788 RepID=A0A6A6TAV3_9PLEO|nr:hypothetical protein K491DRAFT_595716 [Lophiostoma macrostomum CBS 122681]
MPFDEAQKDIVLGHMRHLLENRDWPKTICPSEVARALSNNELTQLEAESWRDVMDDVRRLAFDLREDGEVEVLQKGVTLDQTVTADNVHGPIRIRARQR